MERDIEYNECQYSYSTNNEKPSEVCEYEQHSSNPIDFIDFVIQKSELISSSDYPFHTHFYIFLWLLGLSMYLFCLTTFSEAEKAKSSTFYIVKRLVRLIITILIAPIIFLLLPRIAPKLFDHGLALHYLFSNRYLNTSFFVVPLALLIYELILSAIFFHSVKVISIGRKLIQWSLKHPAVVLVGFVMLTLLNDSLLSPFIHSWDHPTLSLFHYALLLYVFQKNPHLRSKVAKHTRCLLFGILFLSVLLAGPIVPGISTFVRYIGNFDYAIQLSIFYLSVLFLFSLFINFIELKYTVRTPKDDSMKEPLLMEII